MLANRLSRRFVLEKVPVLGAASGRNMSYAQHQLKLATGTDFDAG
jgi:hypothetical protein